MAKAKPIKQPTPGTSTLLEWELWVLHSTLQATGWNISAAARCLEVGRSTLHRKIKRYRLRPPTATKA
jgi:transcriptional regulator of acetoin/glycerol metabolism